MPDPVPPPVAEFHAVVKRRGAALALDGLSLTLKRGEVAALLGPNGAGKSTAVALLTGRLRPDQGRVRLFGLDPVRPAGRLRLGVMLQEVGMPAGVTVAELIDLHRGYYPEPRERAEIVDLAGLAGLERRRCAALSGGQQRRLQFALAISGRPDLLVLDEPSAGLDVEARRALWDAVRAESLRGASILLATHHLEEAEALAERILILDRGRLLADGAQAEIRGAGAASALRCATALASADLNALPGVIEVRREGRRVSLFTETPQATLRALLQRDPEVEDISLSAATLEDALGRVLANASHSASNPKEIA
jgi:ABC-2 type transport system ATP-binding protein